MSETVINDSNTSLLLGPKTLCFCTYLLQYSFYAFRAVFLKDYFGIPEDQIGYVYGLLAAASFAGIAFWSNVADKTRRPKTVYMVLIGGSLLSFMPMWRAHFQVYAVTGLVCAYSFFNFGMNPILSNTVLEMLARQGRTDKAAFGRQVVFGSFAYIVANLVLGRAKDAYGAESVFVVLLAGGVLLAGVVLVVFPNDIVPRHAHAHALNHTHKDHRSSWRVLRNARFVTLLGVIFLTGCARTVMSAFLPLYYAEMRLSGLQSAVLMVSGVALEVASFLFAPQVSALGPYWMLLLAQVFMVVRAWAYVAIPARSEYFIPLLLTELLKGAAFGLTHLAGVRVARDSAPAGLEATAQGFYESCYAQLPSVLSAPLGGLAIKAYGFAALFQIAAWGITGSCAVVVAVFVQSRKLHVVE